ncbi:MAG TPA: D-glycero-beta-D-manno-heptose-7-phosphate kinase [Planctomycetota bacterium]|nr:D-glycero-beta-D-manno-heptose-7-phosphate kinase [Planctomycetota bacterium]
MSSLELKSALETLARPRILVLGDLILDRYITGDVERISPEAPIPVLSARSSEERLGGAGNVSANLRAMEAEVEVLGVLGDDGRARRLRGMLEAIGIECGGCLVDPDRPTTEKTRMLSGGQQIVRVDWERTAPIDEALAKRLLTDLAARVRRARAVVVSDYGKGSLTRGVLASAIEAARGAGVPLLVDPKGTDYSRYRGATLITPNRKEAEEALGRRLEGLDELPEAARELLEVAELSAVVITLGAQGMFHMTRQGKSGHVPTVARAVFDVTGAGDTVIAHLALGMAAGLPLEVAVDLANYAAGIVVGKRGAASATRAEMFAALDADGAPPGGGKVIPPDHLDRALAEWRSQGRRVVFTNGCFDILHAGHVEYLRFARSKGDVLLVGVNDDASVCRLKGDGRPVNPLADRMAVLAALEMVDGVTPFSEDTPARIIERVTPNVLVKGEDWREKGVVGREWVESHGGEVHLAPLVPGRSTSGILERARGQAAS